MDDESPQIATSTQLDQKGPGPSVDKALAADDVSYILDRIVVVGWVLTTPLWLAGYYYSTIWISYGLAFLTIVDVLIHFNFYRRSVAWLILVIVAWIGFIQTRHWSDYYRRTAQETGSHGWLVPADDPVSSRNACHVAPTAQETAIVFGDSVAIAKDWDKRHGKPLAILSLGMCPSLLSLNETPDGLSVDADVFATDGNLAVRVRQNEFNIVEREISYPQRKDRSTLAVYDVKGNELFWLRYANPNTIDIRGTFTCPSGGQVKITDSGTFFGPNTRGMQSTCIHGSIASVQALFSFIGGPNRL